MDCLHTFCYIAIIEESEVLLMISLKVMCKIGHEIWHHDRKYHCDNTFMTNSTLSTFFVSEIDLWWFFKMIHVHVHLYVYLK